MADPPTTTNPSDPTRCRPCRPTAPAVAEQFAGGGLDMGALLEQAAKMQEQLLAAQQEAADTVVEGVAGGGVVKVSASPARWSSSRSTIDPSAVDPDDVEMLQDLVLAALHDAVTARCGELQQGSVGLGGLDLGGLARRRLSDRRMAVYARAGPGSDRRVRAPARRSARSRRSASPSIC